jgi:nicotinamide-nucleotide amidase
MVCFGFAQRASQGVVTRAMTRIFEGDRRQIRNASVAFALSTAIELIGQH